MLQAVMLGARNTVVNLITGAAWVEVRWGEEELGEKRERLKDKEHIMVSIIQII